MFASDVRQVEIVDLIEEKNEVMITSELKFKWNLGVCARACLRKNRSIFNIRIKIFSKNIGYNKFMSVGEE